jgi:cobalt/nickel transport system ATP-binding protein
MLASHDLDMVMQLCDRTIILNEGTVVADGKTLELFSNETLLEENGLEKPLSMQYTPLRVAG